MRIFIISILGFLFILSVAFDNINTSNNALSDQDKSGYLLEENIVSPSGEIDFYYFVDPPVDANLSGSMTCKDGSSYNIKMTINETVPEKHPLKDNDNMFVLESKGSVSVYDDSEVPFTENYSLTEVYNEEGALSLLSASDGVVCVAVESQVVPEIVRVGDSGRIATLKCSDETKDEYSWSISKKNGNIIGVQTARTYYENLDTFDLMRIEHNYKSISMRGTVEAGECDMNMSGSWKSLWWDMSPSWKE